MKLLVATENKPFGLSLASALKPDGIETTTVSHEEALEKFLTEDFDVVLVNDYSEKGDPSIHRWAKGVQTYKDLKASAQAEQKILRCGLDSYEYSDYLKVPIKLDKLRELLPEDFT
jgi:CheY-like chemotaxis protein